MRHLALLLFATLSFGCPSSGSKDSGEPIDTDDTDETPDLLCTEPVEPACFDNMYMELSLHDDMVSEGEVTTTGDGVDWVTLVNATAGGMNESVNNPWVYVRFEEKGAVRVDLDDDTATTESMDWHISFRRYSARLNGGDGGPSCVGYWKASGMEYSEITSVPTDATFATEDFYNDECVMQIEDSGLEGPDLALTDWWAYGGCVETTMQPFLLQLPDSRVVKLVIEAYYGSGQDECNSSGTPGSDSGMLTLRWAYLK